MLAVYAALIILGLPLAIWLATWLLGLRYIPHSSVGVIEKYWSNRGSLKEGRIVAANGEAGFQTRAAARRHALGPFPVAIQGAPAAAGGGGRGEDRVRLRPGRAAAAADPDAGAGGRVQPLPGRAGVPGQWRPARPAAPGSARGGISRSTARSSSSSRRTMSSPAPSASGSRRSMATGSGNWPGRARSIRWSSATGAGRTRGRWKAPRGMSGPSPRQDDMQAAAERQYRRGERAGWADGRRRGDHRAGTGQARRTGWTTIISRTPRRS